MEIIPIWLTQRISNGIFEDGSIDRLRQFGMRLEAHRHQFLVNAIIRRKHNNRDLFIRLAGSKMVEKGFTIHNGHNPVHNDEVWGGICLQPVKRIKAILNHIQSILLG